MSDALVILEKLNSFYSNAFTQLITYTVGVLAFIGIIIPFAIAAFQNRQLKKDQASLSGQISQELAAARAELKREIDDQLSKREEKIQQLISDSRRETAQEIRRIDRLAMARSLHLQAAASLVDQAGSAAFDALNAATNYAEHNDEQNLLASLRLFEGAIPRVDSADFDAFNISEACDDAVQSMEKLNQNGRYTEEITSLKRAVAAAKKRVPAKPATKD